MRDPLAHQITRSSVVFWNLSPKPNLLEFAFFLRSSKQSSLHHNPNGAGPDRDPGNLPILHLHRSLLLPPNPSPPPPELRNAEVVAAGAHPEPDLPKRTPLGGARVHFPNLDDVFEVFADAYPAKIANVMTVIQASEVAGVDITKVLLSQRPLRFHKLLNVCCRGREIGKASHFLCDASPPRIDCCSRMATAVESICRKFVFVPYSDFKFRLVSYNILAQAYVTSTWFPHSPPPCLEWEARSQAVLNDLKSLEADFLCLQEVDEYDSFYRKNMENLGYASIYIKSGGEDPDGCAIFYKQNNAELVLEEKIDYNDLVDTVEDGQNSSIYNQGDSQVEGNVDGSKSVLEQKDGQSDRGDPNDPRVRLKRDCVGIMAAFRLNYHSHHHHVIIANTHLYWNPDYIDVKVAQAKYLLSRLDTFKKLVSEKFDCSPSILVTGDFNSVPGDMVYKYVVSGTTNLTGAEAADDLPIPLSSVYAFTRGEPEFTNCTPGFTGTLDYIFFSPSGGIKPISYLELPGSASPDVLGGLPNYLHPSDHLPIGAEFEVVSWK